ncbi:MAG: DUF5719 family protein [Microthrixaceae bacterium]
MKRTRWPVVILILVAVVALLVWFPGTDDVGPSRVLRSPVAASVGTEGGSWYCASSDVGVEAPTHTVIVSAVSDEDALLRLDAFNGDGEVGTSELEVPGGTTAEVDASTAFDDPNVSVMVEADAPVAVEHRYVYESGADQAPCTNFSSDTWYFPTLTTSRDAQARLSLFNPFPGDASVDISIAFDSGVRQPTSLSGVVIPPGTTRVVELSEDVQRRDQFSATITSRSGGVVAEVAQRFDGSGDIPVTGLRLVPGTRSAAPAWAFAGGFADSTAIETMSVLNPTDQSVDVLAQVVPYGSADLLPEPFELEIPKLRYGLVNLTEESRVQQVGYHAIDVEASGDGDVVSARALSITGAPESEEADEVRASITGGTTASSGASHSARRWVAPGMAVGETSNSVVFVHNFGSDPALVTVTGSPIDGSDGLSAELEIPPKESAAVNADQLVEGAQTFTAGISSDNPVVVERLQIWTSPADLSIQSGIAVVETIDELFNLGD